MPLVRVTRSPVTVDAAVTLEEGPRSCSATMHEAFARLRAGVGSTSSRQENSHERVPRVEVHVVKLRRRRP